MSACAVTVRLVQVHVRRRRITSTTLSIIFRFLSQGLQGHVMCECSCGKSASSANSTGSIFGNLSMQQMTQPGTQGAPSLQLVQQMLPATVAGEPATSHGRYGRIVPYNAATTATNAATANAANDAATSAATAATKRCNSQCIKQCSNLCSKRCSNQCNQRCSCSCITRFSRQCSK